MSDAHRTLRRLATLAVAALLAACASRPPVAPGGPDIDGPEARLPAGLERVPDAEPRIEPLRVGGPNKPYEVLGEFYSPAATDLVMRETGLASWYGRKFHGRRTASGERYDMYAMTAAHKTMPIPSYARVRNPANGREIIVRVNDRGPFSRGRVIDLSYTAALKLGVLGGVAPVEIERLTHDEIRSGVWQRGREPVPAPLAPPLPLPEAEDPLLALASGAGSAAAVPGPGIWLQLGAFQQRDGAAQLQQRVQREASDLLVAVFEDGATFRVQSGPYRSRAEALSSAQRLNALLQLLVPLVVERR